jgi:hypothetical protein
MPCNINSILDGFAGSQSFSFQAKKMGYQVITNVQTNT